MPLVNFLSAECNVSVEIINSGQHTKITENNFRDFDKNVTYKNVFTNKENISKYSSGFIWILNFMFKYLFFRTLKKQNNHKKYICVIHGDTVSTLMGLLWAKRNSCNVLHLESGLTSMSIFNPFPEEIIRRLTSRFSDILICFDMINLQVLLLNNLKLYHQDFLIFLFHLLSDLFVFELYY